MFKDIPEVADYNLDERLAKFNEIQKELDKGLEVPRAREAARQASLADLRDKFLKAREASKARKERAERLEKARKRAKYDFTFLPSDLLKFEKGDFLYLPQPQPRTTKMTSVTIIRKY